MRHRYAKRAPMIAALLLVSLAIAGCSANCAGDDPVCNGRGVPTASETKSLMNSASIRSRLAKLARWIGPTAGGVSFNMYGEIWARTALTTFYGVAPDGSKLTVDYAENKSPEEDPNWGPLGRASVPLRGINASVLPRILALIHRRFPHEIFQGAKVSRADPEHGSGLVWEFDTANDGTHDGVGAGEFFSRANGSGLCLEFSKKYPCRDDLEDAAP